MATVKFFGAAADMTGGAIFLAQYYGLKTSTKFEVLDRYGTPLQIFYGDGFYYSGWISGGNIDRYDLFRNDGSLASIWDIDITAQQYNSATTAGNSTEELHELILQGNDSIVGTDFGDRIRASTGVDTVNGRLGFDIYSALDLGLAITVDLQQRTASSHSGSAKLVSIEGVEGSSLSDTLLGSTGNNTFQGFSGNDLIDGRGGVDTAIYRDGTYAVAVNLVTGLSSGGSGADQLISIENIVGSRFNDTLTGNSEANVIDGFLGDDTIDGREGTDTVDYHFAYNSVTVALSTGKASGAFGTDTLVSIENVIGSFFADRLTGSSAANDLSGLNGDDVLAGLGGNDILRGGEGRDQFVFRTSLHATRNVDKIVDFSVADDTIVLENAIFTTLSGTGVLSAASFLSNSTGLAGDTSDRIIYEKDTGELYYDSNGISSGGGVLFAKIDAGLALTNADFLII